MLDLQLALAAEDFAHAQRVAEELASLSPPPLAKPELELRAALSRARLAKSDPRELQEVAQRLSAMLERAQKPFLAARLVNLQAGQLPRVP